MYYTSSGCITQVGLKMIYHCVNKYSGSVLWWTKKWWIVDGQIIINKQDGYTAPGVVHTWTKKTAEMGTGFLLRKDWQQLRILIIYFLVLISQDLSLRLQIVISWKRSPTTYLNKAIKVARDAEFVADFLFLNDALTV